MCQEIISVNKFKQKESINNDAFFYFFKLYYRTPCISFFSNGCSANDTRPRAIGTIVKIKKK